MMMTDALILERHVAPTHSDVQRAGDALTGRPTNKDFVPPFEKINKVTNKRADRSH